MKLIKGIALLSSAAVLSGCFLDDSDDDAVIPAPAYSFTSVVDASGSDAVSYSGQATRHLLINELKALIGSDELAALSTAEIVAKLKSVYESGTLSTDKAPGTNLLDEDLYTGVSDDPTDISISLVSENVSLKQTDFSEVSGGKNLRDKVAGQDNALTQEFIGWTTPAVIDGGKDSSVDSVRDVPHSLVLEWFGIIADQLTDADSATTYVSATGVDYQQLVQKFLLGAVTYSQAAEDYLALDHVKATKGLKADNTEADDEKPYTALEHAWDEGFGYFGAGRDYVNRTDADNKSTPDFDQNQDGQIDLYTEYNFGHSVNAVKRDLGATTDVDFSAAAFNAFKAGRQLIQDNYGSTAVVDDTFHTALSAQATIALNNWENAIAATVVHYINDVISDTESLGTANETAFLDRAKHWSEMKGFALGLQFSPISQIDIDIVNSDADLAGVLNLMGMAPVLIAGQAADDYIEDLKAARLVLQTAYGFDATDVANW